MNYVATFRTQIGGLVRLPIPTPCTFVGTPSMASVVPECLRVEPLEDRPVAATMVLRFGYGKWTTPALCITYEGIDSRHLVGFGLAQVGKFRRVG
jgi:hypothetical protein